MCYLSIIRMLIILPINEKLLCFQNIILFCYSAGGAYVKWRDSQGRCAMQLAVEMGKASVLECFLMHGVNISKHPALTKR